MNTVNSADTTRTGNTKHANTAAPRLDTGLGSNSTQVYGLNIALVGETADFVYNCVKHSLSIRNN